MVDLKRRGNFINRNDWPQDLCAVYSYLAMKKEEHDPEEKIERQERRWFDTSSLLFSRNAWDSICQERGKGLVPEARFDVIPVFDDDMPQVMWVH
jgi:hypothetical protein